MLTTIAAGGHGGSGTSCEAFSIPCSMMMMMQDRRHHHHHHRILLASSVTDSDNDTITAAPNTDVDDSNIKSLTQRIMERVSSSSSQSGGAGSASTWEAFKRTEANWSRLKSSSPSSSSMPVFITDDGACGNPKCWEKLRNSIVIDDRNNNNDDNTSKKRLDYDVAICGGTLGIFIATALISKTPTLRVAVIEAARLSGRDQEWNISRKELEELVALGVLTEKDLEMAITTEFPGCRAGFKNREGESIVLSL